MRTADEETGRLPGASVRSYLSGLGAIGVLLAIAIGTPAALLVATGRSCACIQPPDLVVRNADSRPATVTWQHEGLSLVQGEDDAGSVTVKPCDSMTATLPAGRVHVVVTSATAMHAFDLDIPHKFATDPFAWLVVRDGGAVEDASPSDRDADPLSACGPSVDQPQSTAAP